MSGPLDPQAPGFAPRSLSPAVIMPASTPSPTKGRALPRFGVSPTSPPASPTHVLREDDAMTALGAISTTVRARPGFFLLPQPRPKRNGSRFKALFDNKYPQSTNLAKATRTKTRKSPTAKSKETPRSPYQPTKDGYNATTWLSTLADEAEAERVRMLDEQEQLWDEQDKARAEDHDQTATSSYLAECESSGAYYPTGSGANHGYCWAESQPVTQTESRETIMPAFAALNQTAMGGGEAEWQAALRAAMREWQERSRMWAGGQYYG